MDIYLMAEEFHSVVKIIQKDMLNMPLKKIQKSRNVIVLLKH